MGNDDGISRILKQTEMHGAGGSSQAHVGRVQHPKPKKTTKMPGKNEQTRHVDDIFSSVLFLHCQITARLLFLKPSIYVLHATPCYVHTNCHIPLAHSHWLHGSGLGTPPWPIRSRYYMLVSGREICSWLRWQRNINQVISIVEPCIRHTLTIYIYTIFNHVLTIH